MLAAQTILLSGCTGILWDKSTFAHSYRPATPANLELFYSDEKRDVLVRYDESRDGRASTRHRSYYAELNAERVNNHRKPRFIETGKRQILLPIAIHGQSAPERSSYDGLHASVQPVGHSFTLYSKGEIFETYEMPTYVGGARRVKQVLLTPFAVAVDCTIFGAIAAYYWGPSALSALNGRQP